MKRQHDNIFWDDDFILFKKKEPTSTRTIPTYTFCLSVNLYKH